MNPAPKLAFVGPMGAGKTTLGARVAQRLGLRFVDLDQHLEQLTGARVPVIFECEGEAGFRARESALLAELCAGQGWLIATGGGAVLDPVNRQRLRASSFVVHLHVGVEAQLARLARDHTRPLLASGNRREKLVALAAQRDALYAEVADLRHEAASSRPETAARRLAATISEHWQRTDMSPAAPAAAATRMRAT